MSKISLEIFNKKRREVFSLLSVFKKEAYLGGGTALALQLKHRQSFDFDVFVQKPVSNRLYLCVKRVFPDLQVALHTEDQLSFYTRGEIRITFLWYYFPPLYPFIHTSSLPLASMEDIAADKAYTIGRRAVWRDYVDIYALLTKSVVDLPTIIGLSKKKFTNDFNEFLFLEQLVYFNDLTVTPIAFIGKGATKKEIASFLEKRVAEHLKQKLST